MIEIIAKKTSLLNNTIVTIAIAMALKPFQKPVIIVGSGLAGLSLAQGLRKSQIPFTVLEKDEAFESRDQGYRFTLAGEGVEALQETLSTELFEKFIRSCSTDSGANNHKIIDAAGDGRGEHPFMKMLAMMKEKDAKPTQFSTPGKFKTSKKVDRRTLREVLIQGVEPQTQFGKAFHNFQETSDGVDVTLSDGSVIAGSVLVGADGAWSRVRRQYLPDRRLKDCETRPILGKTRLTPELREKIDERMLEGTSALQSAEIYGMADVMRFEQDMKETPDDYIFWVLFLKPENYPDEANITSAAESPEKAMDVVRRITKDWLPNVRCLFEQEGTGAAQLQTFTTIPSQLAPNPQAESRVTTIGDAAHLMAQTGASGALTALKDASLLASKIIQKGCSAEALREYESEMIPYVTQAYEQTLMGGKVIFNFKDYDQMPLVGK